MDTIAQGPVTRVVTRTTEEEVAEVMEVMEINREEEPRDSVDLHSLAVSVMDAVLAVGDMDIRRLTVVE